MVDDQQQGDGAEGAGSVEGTASQGGVGQGTDGGPALETGIVDAANHFRRDIKRVAGGVKVFADYVKGGRGAVVPGADRGEIIANVVLAYRHLEDASQRLGKAIQAADGGVSVYDRETTVGA